MNSQSFPVAASNIEINEVADGYVVHQAERGRVHYLNNTAAVILELCNGKNAEAQMPGLLQTAFQLDRMPDADVRECLAMLRAEGLVL